MRALKTREGYLQNLITSDNHHTPWAHSVCNYRILIGRRLVSSPGSSLRPAFIQSPRRRRANQTYPRSEQVSYPGPVNAFRTRTGVAIRDLRLESLGLLSGQESFHAYDRRVLTDMTEHPGLHSSESA